MIRDPTKRVIEKFHELMADKTKHEEIVAHDPSKDVGSMIEEIRPTLLNASEAAGELSPTRAMCLGWLLDNMHLLDANKLYVLKEVMSVLLGTEINQRNQDAFGEVEKSTETGLGDTDEK